MEVLNTGLSKDSKKNFSESPYSDEELEYFRNIILKKRGDALYELQMLQKSLKEKTENDSDESLYSYHMADAGSDVEELEKTYILYNRTRKFIRNLDDALKRIDDKTYGICRVTGKKISKGRLEAVPHTRLSIEAKLRRR